MRELGNKEIRMVSGGHDTSGHSPHQKRAEEARRAHDPQRREYHCTQTGTSGPYNSPTFSCEVVGGGGGGSQVASI